MAGGNSVSSVEHLLAYSSLSLCSENKIKIMAPNIHTLKLTEAERHPNT